MKTLSIPLGRNSQIFYILLIGIFCLPCFAFALEPIGTIGQPLPEQHAFLPDGNILRAVPTHIQVVDADTGAVINEFGERIYDRTYVSDVEFSPNAEHLVILNYSIDSSVTTVNIWDVNAREQVSQWEIPA